MMTIKTMAMYTVNVYKLIFLCTQQSNHYEVAHVYLIPSLEDFISSSSASSKCAIFFQLFWFRILCSRYYIVDEIYLFTLNLSILSPTCRIFWDAGGFEGQDLLCGIEFIYTRRTTLSPSAAELSYRWWWFLWPHPNNNNTSRRTTREKKNSHI